MAKLHKDGTVTLDGKIIGAWQRVPNGRVDRGVALGDWTGVAIDGTEAPLCSMRVDLVRWFDRHSKQLK